MPEGWAWCRLKEIVSINPRNKLDENLEVSFIPMTYIDADYKNTHKQEKRIWKEIKTGFTHFAENDVAIAKISPCFENRKSVILSNLINGYGAGTTELFILRTTSVITPEYLLWIVKTDNFINAGVGNFSGVVGQQRLAKDVVENYFIPLPPLEEQQRIVSSINDAFSQINLIENNSTDLQTAIKQAKSKILELAIHGKLVPQDPNDEPAEELLKRIATSDNRPYKKLSGDEIPFELPKTWIWQKLPDLCSIPITDGTHKTPTYSDKENGIPFLSSKDVTSGEIDWSKIKYITKELHEELYKRLAPQKNDILLAKNGTTGIAALVKDNTVFDIYVTLALIRPISKIIYPQYLLYIINSQFCKNQFNDHLTGIGVPNLHLVDINKTVIPLPPLSEQQRIVLKIEELFEYTDIINISIKEF